MHIYMSLFPRLAANHTKRTHTQHERSLSASDAVAAAAVARAEAAEWAAREAAVRLTDMAAEKEEVTEAYVYLSIYLYLDGELTRDKYTQI